MAQTEGNYSVIKLSQSERPGDRYLNAHVLPLNIGNQAVVLAGCIEITNRWQTAIELGDQLWKTFANHYQASHYRSPLAKFENALKELNSLLDKTDGKVAEPIHCALAVFTAGSVYFSTINNGHLLLWRRGKLSQITGIHLAGERFASVTSGELKKDDWLIVGSHALRDILKSVDSSAWSVDETKIGLLRQVGATAEPTIVNQLIGVTVEASNQGQLETLNLQAPKAARTVALMPKILSVLVIIGSWFVAMAGRLATLTHHQKPARLPVEESLDEAEEEPAAPPKTRHFPFMTVIGGLVVLSLLITGVVIIRNEFKKVSQKPTVVTPTIANLIINTTKDQMFPFIEQNLTIDNYQSLSALEKTQFTTTLQGAGITLVTDTAKVATTESTIVALDNSPSSLYAADAAGNLWRYQTSLTKIALKAPVQNPIALAAMADNKIVLSDQAGVIWLYDGTANSPMIIPLPTDMTQGLKLVQKYGSSNLYIYQVATGNVYKIAGYVRDILPPAPNPPPPAGSPAPTLTPLITPSVISFGTLVDWVIPGDFIGTTETGLIKDFTKSKLETLSIQYYQDNAPIHLSLTGVDGQIAVARGKFVTVYSTADGHKISERVILTNNLISGLSAGPGGSLYASAGQVLYKLP